MPLPFGLKLKRTRRYTVSSKSCLVTRIHLLNGEFVEFTLSVESTGQECLEAVAQRLELREVCRCFSRNTSADCSLLYGLFKTCNLSNKVFCDHCLLVTFLLETSKQNNRNYDNQFVIVYSYNVISHNISQDVMTQSFPS